MMEKDRRPSWGEVSVDVAAAKQPPSARRVTLRGLQALGAPAADTAATDRAVLERMLAERRYADALVLLHETRARRPDDTSVQRAIEALERHMRGEDGEGAGPRSARPVITPPEVPPWSDLDSPTPPLPEPLSRTPLDPPPRRTPTIEMDARWLDPPRVLAAPPPPPPVAAPPAPRPLDDDAYAARYAEATEAYLVGDLALAARLYEECVNARPNDGVAAHNLAKLRARISHR